MIQTNINSTQAEPPKEEEEVIPVDTMEEYNEIDETNPETQDAFAAYLAEGSQKDREACQAVLMGSFHGKHSTVHRQCIKGNFTGGFLSRAWRRN